MEEGDYFAIETFGSTGRGEVHDEGECSHYALMKDAPRRNLTLASSKRLLNTINREFGTLPFARRYVDRVGETNYLLGVSFLPNLISYYLILLLTLLCFSLTASRTCERRNRTSISSLVRCQGFNDSTIRAYHPAPSNMQRSRQSW